VRTGDGLGRETIYLLVFVHKQRHF